MIALVRSCPPVPPLNLHGKEGVSGSSPEEGFKKALQKGVFVVCPDAAPAARGYETGTFRTERALAGTCNPCRGMAGHVIAPSKLENTCERVIDFGSAGAVVPTSFAREEVDVYSPRPPSPSSVLHQR